MAVPVVFSPKSIDRFLEHIRTANKPPKVTTAYIKSVGFKSSNDSALITTFKSLGFIDNGGTPTDRWQQYRGDKERAGKVLGNGIKECYADLFAIYPDAYRKDDEAVANWIRSNSTHSNDIVKRAVSTFKALVSKATFEAGSDDTPVGPETPGNGQAGTPPVTPPPVHLNNPATPAVNINIELQLPATTDPKVYENFFAAMKKYLKDNDRS